MIYVDQLRDCLPNANWPFRKSCHLYADELDELNEFAQGIGLQRSWLHQSPSLIHYDLTPRMRQRAIRAGAVEVSSSKMVEHIRSLRARRR